MKLHTNRKTLNLAHAFTISRWSSVEKHNLFVTFSHEGVEGRGEAAPNKRYNETPQSAAEALEAWGHTMAGDPLQYESFLDRLPTRGQWAAKAALDMAVMDWVGKKKGLPLYAVWGLESTEIKPTSMTIAIAEPEEMARRAREAAQFHVLKVKLGSGDDRAMINAIRNVSDQIIRVDANEGWHDREEALCEIEWLASRNVELVEQPMPAARHEDMIWLKERSPLPLIADEAFTHQAEHMDQLASGYHGVNIKLMKAGGTLPALRAIRAARDLDLDIMLGCMIESGLGIAAALHLAPMADYVDLDGNLLISNDPYVGHPVEQGRHRLGAEPGLGVHPRPRS